MVENLKQIAKKTTTTNKLVKSTNVAIMKVKPSTDKGGEDKGMSFFLPDPNDLTKMGPAEENGSGDGAENGGPKEPAIAVSMKNRLSSHKLMLTEFDQSRILI